MWRFQRALLVMSGSKNCPVSRESEEYLCEHFVLKCLTAGLVAAETGRLE